MSSNAFLTSADPLYDSCPLESNATRGCAICCIRRTYAYPMYANCTKYSGLQSGFAPKSRQKNDPVVVGKKLPIAGRITPGTRPTIIVAAAITAPELPAETKA